MRISTAVGWLVLVFLLAAGIMGGIRELVVAAVLVVVATSTIGRIRA